MKRVHVIALVLLLNLLLPATASVAQGPLDYSAEIEAETVMKHVRALSVAIGARPMGSEAEALAADYVAAALADWGYEVEVQTFETTPPGAEAVATSQNVIATLPGDEQILVVGAHLDSVDAATGAGDNASGVAAMLAAAEALRDAELVHTVMFVAFGAEEGGDPSGAVFLVEQLGPELDNVIAMINIDSVGVGTTVNVYAGATITWPEDESEDAAPTIKGGPTWVRDLALDLAAEMNLELGTTPDDTWGGYTGDWSDHYAFVLEAVPVAYFEAWQWEDAEDPWWGQETAEGDVMHTEGDVYESVVPEKVEMTAEVLAAMTAAIASGEGIPAE
jgi:acetylornithine deacetylase/succinyl-diaminopimelate desuccinylase-like protein